MLSIIAAYSRNFVIGNNGKIPWTLRHEQRRFHDLTIGHAVIMGRKTYQSIGRPLPERQIIVLSQTQEYTGEHLCTAHSLAEAVSYAEQAAASDEIFIAGGASVYKEALPLCSRMYITEIDTYAEGSVLFPAFDPSEFERISEQKITDDAIPYEYITFIRKDGRC